VLREPRELSVSSSIERESHGLLVVPPTTMRRSSPKGGCSDRDHTQHNRLGPQERVLGAMLDQEAPLYPPASLSLSP
jgi:hypothetical protein